MTEHKDKRMRSRETAEGRGAINAAAAEELEKKRAIQRSEARHAEAMDELRDQ